MFDLIEDGAIERPIPDNLVKLIPKNLVAVAYSLNDELYLRIIKMKNVTVRLDASDVEMSDDMFKDRILTPMLNLLNKA